MDHNTRRVADYFILSGIPDDTNQNIETNHLTSTVSPITDLTVIFRGLGEECPEGYTPIEYTPSGHSADLNNGNFKSSNIQICYRRGRHKPPLVEVGVYHEDKERLLSDVEVVYKTPYGRSANTGNTGSKAGTYITFRRAKSLNPYNQLIVVDLCVILNNKGEHPPHAFYSIKKNLNKSIYGMIGSEVFLCYKKTLLSPPSVNFTPQIISRFPLQDHSYSSLPATIPLFCLPSGANVELWPDDTPLPKPIVTTFVLTSDSAQKMYGTSLKFYEYFDTSRLTDEQRLRLIAGQEDMKSAKNIGYSTYATKSICLLSRWPLFTCFEKFLTFLHRLVFYPEYYHDQSTNRTDKSPQADRCRTSFPSGVPLEHHISHFILDVNFPSPQLPTVTVQLMPGTDETLVISHPSSKLPLPLTGASFIQLLTILGVENTMNVLLFGLTEQKLLLHSLRPWVLTGVAEAMTAMLFPFHWQCPYVPLCPLSLHGILNAPLPFIVGVDSRCFDNFSPPEDIVSIDLDTSSIYLSELKRCLNLKILPKRAARVLKNSLESIHQKLQRIQMAIGSSNSPQHKLLMAEDSRQTLERKLELEIQECFVRFMATILRGFRTYLLPITRAPTIGATDPTSLFDFEGFLMSRDRNHNQFYQLITKTQMFTHYIEERSFLSDKDSSLAFFDDCEEKLASSDEMFSNRTIKLFDKDEGATRIERSIYIPAPEQSPPASLHNSSHDNDKSTGLSSPRRAKFGPLKTSLFHNHPSSSGVQNHSHDVVDSQQFTFERFEDQISFNAIAKRTKQEVATSHKLARRSAENPLEWSKYLLSCAHCLWFAVLPSYITYCSKLKAGGDHPNDASSKEITKILRYAYTSIVRMQKHQLYTDEVCFRVLTLLCSHYGQPALAVRVFFEMKKAGIRPNAVTYGYYNKAVLESRWPDHLSKPTTVLWTKVRNVISGIALFKLHGRLRQERRSLQTMPLMADPSFIRPDLNSLLRDKRALVNRSMSTYRKNSSDVVNNETRVNDSNYNDVYSQTIEDNRAPMHKSCSMHLRQSSPERNMLIKSLSIETDDEEPLVQVRNIKPSEASQTAARSEEASSQDMFDRLIEQSQLLCDIEKNEFISQQSVDICSPAGILFSTNADTTRKRVKSTLNIGSIIDVNDSAPEVSNTSVATNATPNTASDVITTLLTDSPSQPQPRSANELLKSGSFGEDAQILRNLQPNVMASQCSLNGDGRSNDAVSESITDASESTPEGSCDSDGVWRNNVTSTPNFKLTSLINDASNLQWSKWTSAQNSKSVYKGIKSAATGIVSSLQEIKSSFSMSNANTPAKLLTTAQHKSTATREMLSQWANYFTAQPSRCADDNDDSSLSSNELLRLSNEEDVEPSTSDSSQFKQACKLFEAIDKFYNNATTKEDLIDHLDSLDMIGPERVDMEVEMTTCSRCNVCRSLLYDEEIMERWSHNESNLNTRCAYCRAKIVPLMSICIKDHRHQPDVKQTTETYPREANLLDFNSDDDKVENDVAPIATDKSTPNEGVDTSEQSGQNDNHQVFSVPYLSPIVLRKELESVLDGSSDSTPLTGVFIDEHPIIFWNLLWYFTRINVPTHLALLCLASKSIRKSPVAESDVMGQVAVKILWDNEKLHSGMGKPLYRLLSRGEY